MTHPAWSDHEIEPGPDSPVAMLSLGWLTEIRRVMAQRDQARADLAYLRYAVVCAHNGTVALTRAEWENKENQ